MPTRPGEQASPKQPSASVSLLDDELMSLGEEGARPGGGRAQQQMGHDPRAHSQLAEYQHHVLQVSILWGTWMSIRPTSQRRKLRLGEVRSLCEATQPEGEAGSL